MKKIGKEKELVKKIYTENVKGEWQRLVRDPFHRLELDTTLRFLKKYLPKKGLILDAGGGPGRYTIELAKKGYDIFLLDFTPANVEFAKKQVKKEKLQKKVKWIEQGSIVNLSDFDDNVFDAVICLGGPLSHVHPEKERKKAISELIRVARKNAPIFVSVMGKFGTLLNALGGKWVNEVAMREHFRRFSIKGDDYMWHGGKSFCHYFTLEELKGLFDAKKVKILETVGLEGLASASKDGTIKYFKNKKIKKNWLEMHYKLCTHSSVVDTSIHMLLIARKK